MGTSLPIIGAFIAGLSLGGFVAVVVSEMVAAKRMSARNRVWQLFSTAQERKIFNLQEKLRKATDRESESSTVLVKTEISGAKDATPEQLADIVTQAGANAAREAFLMRGPEYRQLGPLAFVKFEHLALLRRMGWILQQGLGAPALGWVITDRAGKLLLEGDDVVDLMRRATVLSNEILGMSS